MEIKHGLESKTDEQESVVKNFEQAYKDIMLIGSGFLGKYFLERMFEGYEKYTSNNGINPDLKKPIVTVVDKQNPAELTNHIILENFKNKNYIKPHWGNAAEIPVELLSGIEGIVYTAAIADVPYAMKNQVETYQTNVMNTLQFFEILRKSDYNGQIVILSSESVYGHQTPDKLPLEEDKIIPNPSNVYGSSKLAQEQVALTYCKSYGLNVTVLRSGTMYGEYGRLKQAIPIFITQILERKPVTLDGTGNQTRDFIYVTDVARAIEHALFVENPKSIKGEIINIGSGKEIPFINLINIIGYLVGLQQEDIKIDYRPFRAGEEGLRVLLSTKKAENLLRYKPEVPFTPYLGGQSGITATITWIAQDILNYDKKEMDKLYDTMMPDRKFWKVQAPEVENKQ